MKKGFLVLETGDIFEGMLVGSAENVMGEVVFNTSITGFQDILTNPSYAGQIVVFTYPLVGNYGLPIADNMEKVYVSGMVMGDLYEETHQHASGPSISEQLEANGLTGISGIDTRALVKMIRQHESLHGIITCSLESIPADKQAWLQKKEQVLSTKWVEKVTVQEAAVYENDGPHVAVIDFGYKPSLLQALLQAKCKVTVLPYHVSFEQVQALQPDGILFSNGPGDPQALQAHVAEYKQMSMHYPSLGIGLGHQILALAHGAQTKKLACGHRGINHPVKDLCHGRVLITSQNHSYVVVKESIDDQVFTVTYQNINDGSIEGLKHKQFPIYTVQFYPETYPVPNDAAHIYSEFIQQLKEIGDINYALT